MHTHQNSLIHSLGRRSTLLLSITALVLTSLVCVASARAADGSQFPLGQYGEVPTARFGGFDSTWWDNGAFDGRVNGNVTETAPAPGKFLYPTGFAVDTDDPGGTAIYVLDRVSPTSVATSELVTRWRLQKLSASGEPLARTEFFLPSEGPQPPTAGASTVEPIGLAVDGDGVYTVIHGSLAHGSNTTPYAEEIVGWSTTPLGEELVPAAGGTPDSVSTPVTVGSVEYAVPNVISTESDLETVRVYEPRGLTADGDGSLALLGDGTDRFATEPAAASNAPTVVEQISIVDGGETAGWSTSPGPLAADTAQSISTNPNTGDLDVLLSAAGTSHWVLEDLTPDLTTAHALEEPAMEPSDIYAEPIIFRTTATIAPAGPHLAALSNGLYASPEISTSPGYWTHQQGIRLTSPLSDGTLSSATGTPTTTYDTLGQTTAGACNLDQGGSGAAFGDIVLAAGANGSVWALNVGKDSGTTHIGREVTEFAPGAADPCVAPTPGTTFSLTDESAIPPTPHLANDGTFTVPVGTPVQFGTGQFEYPTVYSEDPFPASVYAFEWDPIGGAANDAGYSLVDENPLGESNLWPLGSSLVEPPTTQKYTYLEPGVFTVKMKALGELGEYDASGTVVVQTTSPPTAAFNLPSTIPANQVVNLEGSSSQPASGAHITNYHWDFGDEQIEDSSTAAETHEYTAPGTYTVKLTVRDNDNQESTPVTHQITVTAPSTGDSGTGSSTGTNSTSSNSSSSGSSPTGTTPGGSTAKPTPTKKPSAAATAKKKLTAALKVCKKEPAKKRAACEKQARAKFSGKSKSKKKK